MAESTTGSAVRILLVEDNPADARLIEATLATVRGGDFDVTTVGRLAGALERVRARWPDVVLLDLSLPDSHGLDGVTRIRTEAPQLPVIVLTGASDPELAQRAFRAGVRDYIVKDDVSGPVLLRSLRHAIECQALQDSVRAAEADWKALLSAIHAPVLRLTDDGRVELLSKEKVGDLDLEGVQRLEDVVEAEAAATVVSHLHELALDSHGGSLACRLARGDRGSAFLRIARSGNGAIVVVGRGEDRSHDVP